MSAGSPDEACGVSGGGANSESAVRAERESWMQVQGPFQSDSYWIRSDDPIPLLRSTLLKPTAAKMRAEFVSPADLSLTESVKQTLCLAEN